MRAGRYEGDNVPRFHYLASHHFKLTFKTENKRRKTTVALAINMCTVGVTRTAADR